MTGSPTAFLDRDGVLNVDRGYVHRLEDLEFVAGAPDAVHLLNDAGFRVVVVTNQSGIARGLYTEELLSRFHVHMQERLAEYGAHVDAFYHCPHHPEGTVARFSIACTCRKPGVGLLEQAAIDVPVDRKRSFMIGDREGDLKAAASFGIRGIKFDHRSQSLVEVVESAIKLVTCTAS